jgi:hypothetical protein
MNTYDLPNYRQFKVTFLGPTNHRGARIKISEPKRFVDGKTVSVTLPYGYSIGDTEQQALNYLLQKGFKPICRASETGSYTILCDNWGSEFIELK